MKKIALVAALSAAIAAPAFAQSSVTLWGRINTTAESQKFGTGSRISVLQNNSSRLGFKGVEDLGGGLKVSFMLEHGLNSDSGTASNAAFWNREASVQLKGDFGAVRLGKWTPGSYFATADYVSMHNHDTGTSSDALYASKFSSTNKIGYFTPNVGGFSAEFSAHAGEGVDARNFDVSANYDQGPMHLGFGFEKQGTFKQFAGRALYEFGALTVGGYVQRETVNNVPGNDSRTIGRLAAMYAVGASEFHLNVGGSKAGGTLQGAGAKQWTMGYNYNLSKRTKIYGFYTEQDSKINARDFSSLAAGVRHNF